MHRARTALRFLPTLSCIFHIFSGWQGRGGLRGKHTTTEASTPSSSPMVVVAAHTPCQGRAVGRGRRGCRTLRYGRSTEEPSAPHGAQACGPVSNVSRFAVLNALVSRFGTRWKINLSDPHKGKNKVTNSGHTDSLRKTRVLQRKTFYASDFSFVLYRGRGEAPVAIVRHRDSHRNLAWRPIPQPRHTGSPQGRGK